MAFRVLRTMTAMTVGLVLAACTGAGGTSAVPSPSPTATVSSDAAPLPEPTPTIPTPTIPTPTAAAQPAAAAPSSQETTDVSDNDDRPECFQLADFESDEANAAWLTVNDNVMGGQSLGGPVFEGGLLVFAGEINTDGGGFSSLRLPLDPEVLSPYDRVELRARPDGRTYMVTFDDGLPGRDRRVSHRASIEFAAAGEWQTVSVAFDDLFPALFGRPIDDLPFRKDLATRMGLMISDGLDGPFRLEIDSIAICPA